MLWYRNPKSFVKIEKPGFLNGASQRSNFLELISLLLIQTNFEKDFHLFEVAAYYALILSKVF
jgi:hypothetical protein